MVDATGVIVRHISANFREARVWHHASSRPLPSLVENEIACCLTLYNEPAVALLVSMAALLRNIRLLRGKPGANALTLCIIADGERALAPSSREALTSLGLLDQHQGREFADLRVYERTVSSTAVEALLARLDPTDAENRNWLEIHRDSLPGPDDGAGSPEEAERTVTMRVLACLKKENAGKLNSHCWFFDVLCPAFNPRYCLQMDAGTAPRPDAIHRLVAALDADQDIGAAASMILVHTSREGGSLLHLWQFGDFALQKLIEWPAEMLCGYLTVIPGQFCIFRWSALSKVVPQETAEGSPWVPPSRKSAPLEKYFRGMNALGAFESNMFLAEDRILGFEILAQRDSRWRLHYENTAVAITDSCDSIPELFRQRRRWTNSTFTCNLWLVTKVGSYLRNSAARPLEKLRTFLAVPWLILNMAFQWFLPALLLLCFKQFVDDVALRTGASSTYHLAATLAYGAFIGLLLLQTFLYVSKPGRILEPVFRIFSFLQIALFATALVFSHGLLLVAFCLESLVALVCALAYSRSLFTTLLKVIVPYTFLRPAMMLTINTYSLCNLHNCSWGTKGLLSVPGLFTPNSPSKPNPIDPGFYAFRALVLGLWLCTNAGVVWALHRIQPGRLDFPLQVVAALLIVLFGVKFLAGLLAALKLAVVPPKSPVT